MAQRIREELAMMPNVSPLLSERLDIPKAVLGKGPIRLVIIGQDPTTQPPEVRARTTTAFDWDNGGPLKTYLFQLCRGLGLDPEQNLNATNLIKCFLREPPAARLRSDAEFRDVMTTAWFPLLATEVDRYQKALIVSLGEPVYMMLCRTAGPKLKELWGYHGTAERGQFSHVESTDCRLGRPLFPFPHATTAKTKPQYREALSDYMAYAGQYMPQVHETKAELHE